MKEISFPPKIIPILSSNERSEISKLIIKNEQIGLAWLEKIRKFISFHNRNLKNISIKRFGKDSSSHLIWMKEIINNQISRSTEPIKDVALLNAALIIEDACPSILKDVVLLNKILTNHQNCLIHSASKILENVNDIPECKCSFEAWNNSIVNKIPVTIFCPSPYSLFSITSLKILISLNINIKAIVILKFSPSRIRSELYRDGISLFFKRVWRKLILRSDENKVDTDLSLKNFKESIVEQISDIRSLAKNYDIPCIPVDSFSEVIDLKKNENDNLCLFTGGGLITADVIDYFSLGIINIHMGPLPQYKGMDVVEAPILDGAFDSLSLTAHLMQPSLDSGPIISKINFSSDEYESLAELRNEMGAMMPIIAVESIISILSNENCLQEQKSLGKQYYFIHTRLRDIIFKVMSKRYKNNLNKSISLRKKKIQLLNSLIADMQNTL